MSCSIFFNFSRRNIYAPQTPSNQSWAKSDSKLQALCPDLDHQAFQAFWGNSRKLIGKGKTNILSRSKLYTYGDHVCTLIKIMFLVSSCYFLFKSYSSLMC